MGNPKNVLKTPAQACQETVWRDHANAAPASGAAGFCRVHQGETSP
jgi:hypothetical protein